MGQANEFERTRARLRAVADDAQKLAEVRGALERVTSGREAARPWWRHLWHPSMGPFRQT